jgi:hypothetical protein
MNANGESTLLITQNCFHSMLFLQRKILTAVTAERKGNFTSFVEQKLKFAELAVVLEMQDVKCNIVYRSIASN